MRAKTRADVRRPGIDRGPIFRADWCWRLVGHTALFFFLKMRLSHGRISRGFAQPGKKFLNFAAPSLLRHLKTPCVFRDLEAKHYKGNKKALREIPASFLLLCCARRWASDLARAAGGSAWCVMGGHSSAGRAQKIHQEAAAPPKRPPHGGSRAVFRGLVTMAVTCRGCSQDLKDPPGASPVEFEPGSGVGGHRWRASLAGVAGGRRWRASLAGVAGGRR